MTCLPFHGCIGTKEWEGDGKVRYDLVKSLGLGLVGMETSTSANTEGAPTFTLNL